MQVYHRHKDGGIVAAERVGYMITTCEVALGCEDNSISRVSHPIIQSPIPRTSHHHTHALLR